MKNILHSLFAFSFCLLGFSLFAQNNLIQWQKSYGGTSYDGAYQLKQTADGGYIVCGYSFSADGDSKGHHGSNGWNPDGWVVKLNANGDTMWTKSLGGSLDEYANDVIETNDGNFVVALLSESNDGDVSVNKGYWDYWVVKLSSTGSILWEKSYGGSSTDNPRALVQSNDGNYVIAGYSDSNDGDATGNKGSDDFWIIKVNSANGNLIWKKRYGGTYTDDASSIAKTMDNGFVVAGYSESNDLDVTSNQGWSDYWVVKLDSMGNKTWQKSMGGDYDDEANSIMQTSDSGYIVAGVSASDTGDVTLNYGLFDYWLVKLNSTGTQIEWQKTIGGTGDDYAYSMVQTTDGGYMVAGYTASNDNDVSGNHGVDDYWLAKIESPGVINWSSTFGGDSLDHCFGMIQTTDGGFALAGLTRTPAGNGDITKNKGEHDLWLVKTFCMPPYVQQICVVTVDSTSTKNLIVWEKPATSNIDSFRVYRDVVGTYTYFGGVSYNDLSKFTDNTNGVNPQITSYKYKVSTVDTCGNESPLSNFHKTIHLNPPTIVSGQVGLVWDNYVGFDSSFYYRILRDTTGTGNFMAIDSVTNSNTTYTDIFAPVLNAANYLIEVMVPSGGCTVTKSSENHNSSRSNKGNIAPVGINQQQIHNLQLTVFPNPNNGKFSVSLENGDDLKELKIFNVLGQTIKTINNTQSATGNKKIEIELQGKGIYFLQGRTCNGFTSTVKLVVE